MLKAFSGEKACPSEHQCGEEGWAKVVTKTVNPILHTKCQMKRSNKKAAEILCYALFSSSASVCLQAVEIIVVLVSFGHEIGFVSLLEHWHRTNIYYL